MNTKHVAVWIDHSEANIFHVSADSFETTSVGSPSHHVHRHPIGSEEKKSHPADAKRFFELVARALDGAEEILIVGPATAKLEFIRHLHKHEHALEQKVVGVETVDHPTSGQLAAYIRHYFHAVDRMRGTSQ
jgi:hypothetical protein